MQLPEEQTPQRVPRSTLSDWLTVAFFGLLFLTLFAV